METFIIGMIYFQMVFHYFIPIKIIFYQLVKQSYTLSMGLWFSKSTNSNSPLAEASLIPYEYLICVNLFVIKYISSDGQQLGLNYYQSNFYCDSKNGQNQILHVFSV